MDLFQFLEGPTKLKSDAVDFFSVLEQMGHCPIAVGIEFHSCQVLSDYSLIAMEFGLVKLSLNPTILYNFGTVSHHLFLEKAVEKVMQKALEEADYLDCWESGFRPENCICCAC